MNVITLPITTLKPYENNPKKHPPRQIEQLMRSIELTKGLTQPIVIDSNNVIVCGHGRYMAAQKLGYADVPCVLVDNLTEDEIRAYRLIDNRIASGEYDLQTEIAELQNIEIDMSNFGFDVPALEIELEDKEIQHEENKQTAVDRFTNILNQNKAEYEGVGEYGIPDLDPVYETPNDDRSAYRDAAADFVKQLSDNDTVTAITVQNYQHVRGGKIISQSPTIWRKNPDGTISRKGSTSKETPEEWARRSWRSSNVNVYYLKGDLTIQQAATELSKIKKRHYEVKEK